MGVGQFTGEMSELSGRGTLASGRAGPEGCTALPFDAAHIRALIVGSAELGEILMRAFILRRVGLLQADGAGSVLIGIPGTADLGRLQNFLSRNGYPCDGARRRHRRGRPRAGGAPRHPARRAAGDGLSERHGAEAADRRRGRHVSRHHAGDRHQHPARRDRGRRRPGGPRGRGLCRLRRTVGAGARSARVRRAGGSLGADRELSRLSDRHFRRGAGRACVQPGAEVRRRGRHPARRWRISTAAVRRGGRTSRCGSN